MQLQIGHITFDHAAYDRRGDVLYLHVGEPRAATGGEETPEGHVIRFGEDDEIIGLTILNARWLIDRDGAITVTLPSVRRVEAKDLEPVLKLAAR